MIPIAALVAALTLMLLSGSIASLKKTCSEIGYRDGTIAHAYCVEREAERFMGAMDSMDRSIQESNRLIQMNRPRTCMMIGSTMTCY